MSHNRPNINNHNNNFSIHWNAIYGQVVFQAIQYYQKILFLIMPLVPWMQSVIQANGESRIGCGDARAISALASHSSIQFGSIYWIIKLYNFTYFLLSHSQWCQSIEHLTQWCCVFVCFVIKRRSEMNHFQFVLSIRCPYTTAPNMAEKNSLSESLIDDYEFFLL